MLQETNDQLVHTVDRHTNVASNIAALENPQFQSFARDAATLILTSAGTLEKEHILHDTVDIARGVAAWIKDDAHGAKHSWHVYEGSKTLRDLQSEYREIPDRDLFLRAVLHDLGEFMPFIDRNGNASTKTRNNLRIHPEIMHRAVALWGSKFDVADSHALANDILYHDYSYRHPTPDEAIRFQEQLSPAGRIFVDADRFAGAGPLQIDDEGIRSSVIDAIARNRTGSLGKWYFLRPDVTTTDRTQHWKPRTQGYFDGASALLSEYFGFPPYLANTKLGQKLVHKRQSVFTKEALRYYIDQYAQSMQALEEPWKNQDVQVGIQEKENQSFISIPDEIRSLPLPDATARIIEMPVSTKPQREGREYFGYSLFHNGSWYDPSIIRFPTKEDVEDALRTNIEDYEKAVDSL